MPQQVAYAIVTPYTIRKSRTGAVLSRLLGQTSSELIAARMFAPTKELAQAYAASISPGATPESEQYRNLIRQYILQNFSPDSDGRRHRALMLVFKGENAQDEIAQIVGHLRISNTTGESLRDAYGDLVWNQDGSVRYFEPAVLTGDSAASVADHLGVWMPFAEQQPVLLENICSYANPDKVEQTLVIIKPDSWRQRSSRPGAIIDMFSRTGLRIIGCKHCQLSISQALEFYGPVKDVLCRKMSPGIGTKAKALLEKEFEITLPPGTETILAEKVGVPYAVDQFERIVEFMSGVRPSARPEAEWPLPGTARCMALIYEGEDAVNKIRNVLGPTDPTKAPQGTVRREFGSDVMVNTAHASDSAENAKREMGILKIRESQFAGVVRQALAECKG